MTARITKQWYEGIYEVGEPIYFITQFFGLKPAMRGHNEAVADFGRFIVVGRHVIHEFYAGANDRWTAEEVFNTGSNDSHMLDDLGRLLKGEVEFE